MKKVTWYWLFICLIIGIFFFLFGSVSFSFMIGFTLAYIFAPVVAKAQNTYHISRTISALAILLMLFALATLAVRYLVPYLHAEILQLIHVIPQYYESLQKIIDNTKAQQILENTSIHQMFDDFPKYLMDNLQVILREILATKDSISRFFSALIIVPISCFYFVRDWPKLVKACLSFIPAQHQQAAQELSANIRTALHKYLHGQITMAFILSGYYTTLLYIANCEYPMFMGIMTGVLSFVPFLGAMLCMILVTLMLLAKNAAIAKMAFLIFGYVLGQFIEGYILAPKFIGAKIGIHPLWILFSFFAGFEIAGILGVFLSLPTISVASYIGHFMITKLKNSLLPNSFQDRNV